MNKTSNYQLCQWDGEDRILRTDFNEDNAKIDAALKNRNCQICLVSYTGDDSSTRTITFPHKPVLIIVLGGSNLMVAIRGCSHANLINNINVYRKHDVTWGDTSFTWDIGSDYPIYGANSSSTTYQMFALLEVE